MKIAALMAGLVMAGCAAPVPLEDKLRAASIADLCAVHFYGPAHISRAAGIEASHRRLNCQDYRQEAAIAWGNYQQSERAKTQAMQNMSRQLLTPAPMPPMPQTCRTVRMGNSLETTCM